MNRMLATVSLCLALAGPNAALAQAGPPPLRVKVRIASDPHLDAAARAGHNALLQSLAAGGPTGGWFDLLPAGLDGVDFEHCTISAQDPRTCASRLLAGNGASGATIVVLAYGIGEQARWQCVGTGERPTNPGRQQVDFDMDDVLDASSPRRMETRAAAAGCITAAGAESGW